MASAAYRTQARLVARKNALEPLADASVELQILSGAQVSAILEMGKLESAR